jgi:hypothetical protein
MPPHTYFLSLYFNNCNIVFSKVELIDVVSNFMEYVFFCFDGDQMSVVSCEMSVRNISNIEN